jgi:MEMO1 family protein
MKRKAYVAGYFYPSGRQELEDMVSGFIDPCAEKKDAVAVICPHAGLIYSGQVAGSVYSSVKLPDTVVLLGPSHGYMPHKVAIMPGGIWEIPFGDIPVEGHLALDIIKNAPWVKEHGEAHAHEHSLEVQLPFLKYLNPQVSIVPILVSYSADYSDLIKLGESIAASIEDFGENVLIISSTDMSHQVPQETARKKDFMAIDKIFEMHPKKLYEVVQENNISMCGFQPTTATMVAAQVLGATQAELILYQTSGDVTGDYNEVVGYAGIRIY